MKREDLKKVVRLKIEDLFPKEDFTRLKIEDISSNEPIEENLGFDETQVNNP